MNFEEQDNFVGSFRKNRTRKHLVEDDEENHQKSQIQIKSSFLDEASASSQSNMKIEDNQGVSNRRRRLQKKSQQKNEDETTVSRRNSQLEIESESTGFDNLDNWSSSINTRNNTMEIEKEVKSARVPKMTTQQDKKVSIQYEEKSESLNLKKNLKIEVETPSKPTLTWNPIKINRGRKMSSVEIEIQNIKIYFPFKPKRTHIEYMTTVIDSLNSRKSAILHSSAGVERNICLYCACLGWLDHQRRQGRTGQATQIVLVLETDSQIPQMISIIKKTCYEPLHSIYSSKGGFCINEKVNTQDEVEEACRVATLKNKCEFYKNYNENKEQFLKDYEQNPPDLEDFFTTGVTSNYCPFYFQQDLLNKSDIIFIPSNALFGFSLQKEIPINLDNAILIFNDIDNIEKAAEEGSSAVISLESLKEMNFEPLKKNVRTRILERSGPVPSLGESAVNIIERIISKLIDNLEAKKEEFEENMEFENQQRGVQVDHVYNGVEIFDMIRTSTAGIETQNAIFEGGINQDNIDNFLYLLELAQNHNTTMIEGIKNFKEFIRFIDLLAKIEENNRKAQNENGAYFNLNSFSLSTYGNYTKKKDDYCLALNCLDPGLGFVWLLQNRKVRNIMLTSDTLLPFDMIKSDLRLNFPLTSKSNHAINPKIQCMTSILGHGRRGIPLVFSEDRKITDEAFNELGNILLNVLEPIPHGVLIHFASESLMNKCFRAWKNSDENLFEKLKELKPIFKETKDPNDWQEKLQRYRSRAYETRGAILCYTNQELLKRNMYLNDELVRAIFVVGVPSFDRNQYAQKISFLEQNAQIDISEWIRQQNIRTINQVVSNAVSSKDDYGMVFFCDKRFSSYKSEFPDWVRANLEVYDDYQLLTPKIAPFFERAVAFGENPDQFQGSVKKSREKVKSTVTKVKEETTAMEIETEKRSPNKQEQQICDDEKNTEETLFNDFPDHISMNVEEKPVENCQLFGNNELEKEEEIGVKFCFRDDQIQESQIGHSPKSYDGVKDVSVKNEPLIEREHSDHHLQKEKDNSPLNFGSPVMTNILENKEVFQPAISMQKASIEVKFEDDQIHQKENLKPPVNNINQRNDSENNRNGERSHQVNNSLKPREDNIKSDLLTKRKKEDDPIVALLKSEEEFGMLGNQALNTKRVKLNPEVQPSKQDDSINSQTMEIEPAKPGRFLITDFLRLTAQDAGNDAVPTDGIATLQQIMNPSLGANMLSYEIPIHLGDKDKRKKGDTWSYEKWSSIKNLPKKDSKKRK